MKIIKHMIFVLFVFYGHFCLSQGTIESVGELRVYLKLKNGDRLEPEQTTAHIYKTIGHSEYTIGIPADSENANKNIHELYKFSVDQIKYHSLAYKCVMLELDDKISLMLDFEKLEKAREFYDCTSDQYKTKIVKNWNFELETMEILNFENDTSPKLQPVGYETEKTLFDPELQSAEPVSIIVEFYEIDDVVMLCVFKTTDEYQLDTIHVVLPTPSSSYVYFNSTKIGLTMALENEGENVNQIFYILTFKDDGQATSFYSFFKPYSNAISSPLLLQIMNEVEID